MERLFDEIPPLCVIDTYEDQLKELLILEQPHLYDDATALSKAFETYRSNHYGNNQPWESGYWVYLPWRSTLVHVLADEQYQLVRTARNQNLITAEEQIKFYNGKIGIAGLSVGSSVALAIVQSGGGKYLRLADPDVLALSNLNRIRSGINELTEPKVYTVARQIYELNPYAKLTLYPMGLTSKNIKEFTQGLDVIVDEMDNLAMKVKLRQYAAKTKTPLLMATDNGEAALLDVERHDQAKTKPFHGRLRLTDKKGPVPSRREVGLRIAQDFVGLDITEPRMYASLQAVGKSLATWPQLGTTAWLSGIMAATAVRRIILNQPLVADRVVAAPLPALL